MCWGLTSREKIPSGQDGGPKSSGNNSENEALGCFDKNRIYSCVMSPLNMKELMILVLSVEKSCCEKS